MKFRDSWTIDDLKTLIDAADSEHVDLEFKSYGALTQDSLKKIDAGISVSAFANGTGGIVVYGVKELKEGAYEIDEGFDPNGKITKDWLSDVLDTQIHPHIQGLTIFRIELDEKQKRFALLVQVPRSEVEPHQASDKKYYLRRDGKKVPMTHQEVKDAFFRAHYPNLQVRIHLAKCTLRTAIQGTPQLISNHEVEIINVGRIMASDYLIKFSSKSRVFNILEQASVVPHSVQDPDSCGAISSMHLLYGKLIVQRKLFPGQSIVIRSQRNEWNVDVVSRENESGKPMAHKTVVPIGCDLTDKISCAIHADNAPSKSGSFALGDLLPRELLVPLMSAQQETVELRIDDVEPLCLG